MCALPEAPLPRQEHHAAAAQACKASSNQAAWVAFQIDMLFDPGPRGQATARPHYTYMAHPGAAETCHHLLRRATILLSKVHTPALICFSAWHACLAMPTSFVPLR
jgi:hypothetical protein